MLFRSLESEAQRLEADVQFLGHLSGQSLVDEIRACRATVLAAEWYENAPMSILESFALGKPVIGARIGGIPELVREGSTGWLFESGSVSELADSLRAVASLRDSCVAEVGRAARGLVESEYSSNLYRERMNRLYADMASEALVTTPG